MTSPIPGSNGVGAVQTVHQDRLANWCRSNGFRPPSWQIVSDRRGGRTAWSCTVLVQGQQFHARFWYDGQFVNNAKEDASERALQMLGVIPSPPVPPQMAHLQQQSSSQQRPSYYGAVSG